MKPECVVRTGTIFVAVTLLGCAGCASTSTSAHGRAQTGAATVTHTKTATVESIDPTTQTLMLRNPDGRLTGYFCRPEVRNFDQIKIGDRVTFTETVETDVSFAKGGRLPGASASTAVVRAPLGAKPSGTIVETTAFVGKVVEVDPHQREVTIVTGAAGVLKTVNVSRAIDLSKVKPGQDAGVRVTQVTAISVESP